MSEQPKMLPEVYEKSFKFPPLGKIEDEHDRPPMYAGFGACKSCSCKGYIKSGDGETCGNCRHNYYQHY